MPARRARPGVARWDDGPVCPARWGHVRPVPGESHRRRGGPASPVPARPSSGVAGRADDVRPAMPRQPSHQAVQRTPLARFMGLGAIHVPSGAANRHVGPRPRLSKLDIYATIY